MTDTPKPPMVVWVHERHTEIATLVKPNKIMDAFSVGPYVHLDQFLAEVERRAKGIMQQWHINIVEARGEALQLLADDIRRGQQ